MVRRAHLAVAAIASCVLALTVSSCGDPKVDHREVAKHSHAAPVTLHEACQRVDEELPRVVSRPPAYAALEQVLADLYREGNRATRAAIADLRPSTKAMATRGRGHAHGHRATSFQHAVDRFTEQCAAAGSTALE